MQKSPLVKLTPRQIDNKGILTISSDSQAFNSPNYRITDASGKVIRQGNINSGMKEIKLYIVGFNAGNYQVIIGTESLRFTVI